MTLKYIPKHVFFTLSPVRVVMRKFAIHALVLIRVDVTMISVQHPSILTVGGIPIPRPY